MAPSISDRGSIRVPAVCACRPLRPFLLAAVIALGMMFPVRADYEGAVYAYYRQDYETALREFKTLAAAGDKNAQYNAGLMYLKGQGAATDPEEAARWFHRAALQGQVDAQSFLGALYADGQGLRQDYTLAAYWWRRAAEAGHPAAQSFLGQLYLDGLGVARDYVEAYVWFSLAEATGYPESRASREKAGTFLSAAEHEDARCLIQERLPNRARQTQELTEP